MGNVGSRTSLAWLLLAVTGCAPGDLTPLLDDPLWAPAFAEDRAPETASAEDPEGAPAPADARPFPVEVAPPPGAGGLLLALLGVLEPGNTLRLSVEGAAPGASLLALRGEAWQLNAACPPSLGGLCVDLLQPQRIGRFTANANGYARATIQVPPNPDHTVVAFQVVSFGPGAATSNVIEKFNPLDVGGAAEAQIQLQGSITASGGVGFQDTVFYSPQLVRDTCVIRDRFVTAPLPPTIPPCPGCDFAFTYVFQPPEDASVSGSCRQIHGFQIRQIDALNTRYEAFDADYFPPGAAGPRPVALQFEPAAGQWLPASNLATWNGSRLLWTTQLPGTYAY